MSASNRWWLDYDEECAADVEMTARIAASCEALEASIVSWLPLDDPFEHALHRLEMMRFTRPGWSAYFSRLDDGP